MTSDPRLLLEEKKNFKKKRVNEEEKGSIGGGFRGGKVGAFVSKDKIE